MTYCELNKEILNEESFLIDFTTSKLVKPPRHKGLLDEKKIEKHKYY